MASDELLIAPKTAVIGQVAISRKQRPIGETA
jgi:hypothetical protein